MGAITRRRPGLLAGRNTWEVDRRVDRGSAGWLLRWGPFVRNLAGLPLEPVDGAPVDRLERVPRDAAFQLESPKCTAGIIIG